MNRENAETMQARLAKEAVALMSHLGPIDTGLHERMIVLAGEVWEVPPEDTQAQLDLIRSELEVVQSGKSARELPDVLPESELRQWTGLETLEMLEDLFETAVQLETREDRLAMLDMARRLMEYEGFTDWIEKTPGEQENAA